MLQPLETIYEGPRLTRTPQKIRQIAAIAGAIKSVTIEANNVTLGDYVFNVKKNGTALFSGSGRMTINSENKIVTKSGLDIAVALGDLISFHLEEAGQTGLLPEIYFIVNIDDGVEAEIDIAADVHAATAKTTPVNNDEFALVDSAASNVLKKLFWSNIKATLKTYFDTFYQAALVSGTNIKMINSTSILGSGNISISAGASDLDDLTDVAINSPTSGQVLKYDGTVWKNDVDDESAGGSSIEGFRVDSEPPAPSAESDWFRGSTFDGKWTLFQPTYSTATVERNSAKFVMPSQAGDRITGLFQLLPSGDCSIIVKVTFRLVSSAPTTYGGITLFQDATNNPNTSDLLVFVASYNTGIQFNMSSFSKFDTFGTFFQNVGGGVAGTYREMYLRLSRTGTDWTPAYSLDGLDFSAGTSVNESLFFAPAEFGVAGSCHTNGNTNLVRYSSFRYFNYANATLLD